MGRNLKVYKYLGKPIVGLSKIGPNRWRISQTGERFTEADEYNAIQYFRQQVEEKGESLFIPIASGDVNSNAEAIDALDPKIVSTALEIETDEGTTWDEDDVEHRIGHRVDRKAFFAFVRHLIIHQKDFVAQETGIAQIALLDSLTLPKESLALQLIADTYSTFSTAKRENSKRGALKAWERMAGFCEAKVLSQLTTDKLLAYADSVANDPALKSGGSKRALVRRVKTVLGFALTRGLDTVQIRETLDRMKVLNPKRFKVAYRAPHPVSREDYQKLLSAAVGKNESWRVWLLLGMNLCQHLFDVCNLRWESFNMSAGTYAAIREKTEAERIPQVAVLWDETLSELKKVKRTGSPYVLNSRTGTKYHRNAKGNAFLEFTKSVGVKVVWDDIRDGAYSAAMRGSEEKWARVLAGHRAPGLLDSYVLRSPECVKSACDAVHKHYLG